MSFTVIQAPGPEGEECMNAQAKNKGEATRVSSRSQCDTRQEECWSSKMESIYLYISNRFECRYRASSVSPPACRSDTEVQTIAAATNKVSRAPNNAVYIQLSIKAATRGRRRLQEVLLLHYHKVRMSLFEKIQDKNPDLFWMSESCMLKGYSTFKKLLVILSSNQAFNFIYILYFYLLH